MNITVHSLKVTRLSNNISITNHSFDLAPRESASRPTSCIEREIQSEIEREPRIKILTLFGSTEKCLAAASPEFCSADFATDSLNCRSYLFLRGAMAFERSLAVLLHVCFPCFTNVIEWLRFVNGPLIPSTGESW